MKNTTKLFLLFIVLILFFNSNILNAQTATFNFNGTTAVIGGYNNDSSGTVQTWTVPGCVTTITVTATGGAGGSADYSVGPKYGGLAAVLTGTLTVTPGHVLNILVGAAGAYGSVDGGGGGGGTFIWDNNTNTILVVAGGGGGAGINEGGTNGEITNTTAAKLEKVVRDTATSCGAGGTGGNGGAAGSNINDGSACGGAGWLSNGGIVSGGSLGYSGFGIYPENVLYPGDGGSAQGNQTGAGGYGGGAGGGYNAGGGGGGYNGGGGGKGTGGFAGKAGGGGGSYFDGGVALSTSLGTSGSDGSVIIQWNTSAGVSASISSFSDPTCNGGTGTATGAGSGGITPYTYSWNPSAQTNATATGLTAASYTVTVTDNGGCTATASVTLTQPTAVTATMGAPTYPLCNGQNGSCGVTAGGGTGAYTYSWSPTGGSNSTGTGLSAGNYTVTVTDHNGCTATASVSITQPTTLTSGISMTQATCGGANGTASATPVGGGTTPYTYSWNPTAQTNATATGLSAGNYTVTVTDKHGCTVTASIAVTSTGSITASITTSTGVLCSGGSTGTATGAGASGSVPYTYSWNPSAQTNSIATGLSAGNYTVTVTDHSGCTATASIAITQPTALTTGISMTQATCGGTNGTATAAPVGGGTGAYTYSWNPLAQTNSTATGLSAGIYTVTVTDHNACTVTASISVTTSVSITASISSSTGVLCNGGSTGTATGAGGGGSIPYTYSWNPTAQTNAMATGLSAGNYTVTVTDHNGCIATASVSITQPVTLTTGIGMTQATCGNTNGTASAAPAGGTSPYTYSWNPSAQTNTTATGLSAGNYTVTVTDKNACTVTASISVTSTSAITASISGSTGVLCNGGITGTATGAGGGGSVPYTYSWNPSAQTNSIATGLSAGNYTVTVTDHNGCTATASVAITQPIALTTPMGMTSATCLSTTGTATSTPAGGTSPYTYSWNPSAQTNATATGLSAGNYTVTITDHNGCTATGSVSVTSTGSITASVSGSTGVLCNGGSTGTATGTPGGGSAPYTYSWNPSAQTNSIATGLSAGNYTVTITDHNGCSATASIVITQPIALTSGISMTQASCGATNGTATSTPSGGTSPYTYSWNPSAQTTATATGLSGGNYTVTVTDKNACTVTASVLVTSAAAITASITGSTGALCNAGNTGTATATPGSGTAPFTYLWSPAGGSNAIGSGLSAGNYTVTVTDHNGCTATASVSITQPTAVTATMGVPTYPLCNGQSGSSAVTPGGGTSPYTYSWSPAGGSNANGTGLTAGNYTVTLTDHNGCAATASVTITQPAIVGITIASQTYPLCNGGMGSATANTATGGTSPYDYNWTPSGGTNLTAALSAGNYTVTVTDARGCSGTASVSITQPTSVAITMSSQSNPLCNGSIGSATANTATGGTSPYNYNWTPSGGTNLTAALSAGNYTVTATDTHGCSGTASVSIIQPAAVGITIASQTSPVCNGGTGSATANVATGGTSPYNYIWTPTGGTNLTASALSAGSYTITTTDAHGCIGTASVIIIQPAAVAISIASVSTISCQGVGSITSHPATGGTGPYNYNWAPGGGTNLTISNLSAGTYTITARDANGCTASAAETIIFPTQLNTTASTATNVTCYGEKTGTVLASPSGGSAPYTYSWFPGAGTHVTEGGLSAGTYTVTVTDNSGCTTTAKATITEPAGMVIKTDSIDAGVGACNGMASVTVISGGTAPFSYLWSHGGETTDTIKPLCEGSYCCTITQANGCSQDVCIIVETNTGIGSIGNNSSINVYPNPSNGQFTISGIEQGMQIEVYDYIGRKIDNIEAGNATSLQVNIANQPNGIYLVRILNKAGVLVNESKVVKTK